MLGLCFVAGCPTDRSEPKRDQLEHAEREDDKEEHAEGTVRISPAALERAGVRIEVAAQIPLSGGVRVPSEVTPDPDQVVHAAPLVEGQIAEVRVSVGDHVEEGTLLAVLRSVALGETRAAMAEAQAELSVAKANYERQRDLVKEEIGARRNLVEAEGALRTARARVEGLRDRTRVYGRGGSGATTFLRSTIAGEIVERHATVGEVVGPDRTLFVIVDPSPVWVMGAVYPQDIATVHEGAEVTFLSPDLPGQTWSGPLAWVSPMVDEDTRTLPVRMVLENPEGTIRPGLFGTILVPTDDAEIVTIVDTGLVELDGGGVVFVPTDEEGEFEIRSVSTGRRDEGRVEILEGLAVGERYVAEGTFVLKSQQLSGELGEGHAH
ncbi:MAG: efflux RND transporter periplasmic adaptor subunit [Nannocystaceae bacterium]|nr:efflux RND transporter periplasmic adaptor subunit [bacterium]